MQIIIIHEHKINRHTFREDVVEFDKPVVELSLRRHREFPNSRASSPPLLVIRLLLLAPDYVLQNVAFASPPPFMTPNNFLSDHPTDCRHVRSCLSIAATNGNNINQ